jgi:hypothetical protein
MSDSKLYRQNCASAPNASTKEVAARCDSSQGSSTKPRAGTGSAVSSPRPNTADRGANPRYVVTNLQGSSQALYDETYCARGEMENRIKEQQLGLFSDRTSCHAWWANQFRLLLSSAAYVLLEALRRIGLKGTELARAQVTNPITETEVGEVFICLLYVRTPGCRGRLAGRRANVDCLEFPQLLLLRSCEPDALAKASAFG